MRLLQAPTCSRVTRAAHDIPLRRPRHRRPNACVREYELFQRSNAMPPAKPTVPARPAVPTARSLLVLVATVPRPVAVLTATVPRAFALRPATAPRPSAFLATARTRPVFDLPVAPSVDRARPEIRSAGFLRDLLDALFLVDRFALEDFEPFRRAEVRRRRTVVEPVPRVPLERRVPERLDRVVFVCGICLLSWIEFALIRSYPQKKTTTPVERLRKSNALWRFTESAPSDDKQPGPPVGSSELEVVV